MVKILSADILDILPIEIGFIILTKEISPQGDAVAAAFAYDQEGNQIHPIPISTYRECKFGPEYKVIASYLGDYISCSAIKLKSGGVTVLYPTGETAYFNDDGSLSSAGNLIYQGCPTRDITLDGECFWSTVPDKNAIIRYSPVENRVLLRIGGEQSSAFKCPTAILKIEDKLYICNEGNNKIRTIRLEDYAVKDYAVFNEPVHKFFRVGAKDYALLDSGIYWINNIVK